MIKPGDLVCVTRKCCEVGPVDELIGVHFVVTGIGVGDCIFCGVPGPYVDGYERDDTYGICFSRLTKIDPLKEPETVEEEAHA